MKTSETHHDIGLKRFDEPDAFIKPENHRLDKFEQTPGRSF